MSQATRRWISEEVQSLRDSRILPFHEILDAGTVSRALHAEGVSFHERIYTPLVTACLFLSQVIDPDRSCRAAVARLIVWMAVDGRKPRAPDTSSYREARQRLPEAVIVRLVRETARRTDARALGDWLWEGRSVILVDGTTASMPDSSANREAYPQSKAQGIGLGFPLVRPVALISPATGVVRDLALGPYQGEEAGETASFRTLRGGLDSGEIGLGDRVFGSYFGIAGLSERGVDGLFRMHQRRKFDFRRGRRLGALDHVVSWSRPARPDRMDEATYAQIPEELAARESRVTVDRPGFRVNRLVPVTTPLDAGRYTKQDISELSLERWNTELDFRSIKGVLRMDVLRCMTPEMVRKEVWRHLLAYNLVRGVMRDAAEAHDKVPRQLSFQGALQTMTAFQDALRWATPIHRVALVGEMLKAISSHEVGDRFGRVEPRANKRRPKPQRFPMEPRRQARKALLALA